MLFRGITRIGIPTVRREGRVQLQHVSIPVGLGQSSLRNGSKPRIPLDIASVFRKLRRSGIDCHRSTCSRLNRQRPHRAPHGRKRCIQDVDAVDFLGRNMGHGPRQRMGLNPIRAPRASLWSASSNRSVTFLHQLFRKSGCSTTLRQSLVLQGNHGRFIATASIDSINPRFKHGRR